MKIASELILIFLIFYSAVLRSQNVIEVGNQIKINVDVPTKINVGEKFIITYDINRNNRNIILDNAFNGFELDYGPHISSTSSMSNINGKVFSSNHTIFEYSLIAKDVGIYVLPRAIFDIDNKKYYSDSVLIHVLNESFIIKNLNSKQLNTFLELSVSKTDLYKYEPVIVQLKLYSKSMINSIDEIIMPSFDNFIQYEIKTENEIKIEKETINGDVFNSAVIMTKLMVPLKSGEAEIGQAKLSCKFKKSNSIKSSSFIDNFSTTNSSEELALFTDSLKLNIKDFPPEIPDNFVNIYAKDLKISVLMNEDSVFKNNPFLVEIKISGNGNLKLLDTPEMQLPPHLHLVNTFYLNNLKADINGISGERTFYYEILADTIGKFKISPIEMVYFNGENDDYQKIFSRELIINVKNSDVDNHFQEFNNQNKFDTISGYASMILLDLSQSMMVQDYKPNRKTSVINELIDYLNYTKQNVGIVVYSAIPYLLNPITDNKKMIIKSFSRVDSLKLGDGTSTGFGICMAVDELRKSNIENKNIILITDGESNMGSIREQLAIEMSNFFNIPIDIIGICSDSEKVSITINTDFGERTVPVKLNINNEKFHEFANFSGGEYYMVKNSVELHSALKEIDTKRCKKNNIKNKSIYTKSEILEFLNLMYQDISEQKKIIENKK